MNKKELDVIIEKHGKWLRGDAGGECANLQCTNLQGADLQDANLQDANLQDTNLRGANLRGADLQGADLRGADLQDANLQCTNLQDTNLRGVDLQDADLRGADLQGADLDYSCLPMWCGGSRFKCSPALIRQIFAHVCSLEVIDADEETKTAIEAVREEARKSHRAGDLGLREE